MAMRFGGVVASGAGSAVPEHMPPSTGHGSGVGVGGGVREHSRREGPVERRPTILVTDDDAATRKLYREVLEIRRFNVVEARNGEDCVQVTRLSSPALIVLDLHMPVRDGFSAAREIRADPRIGGTPIVAVSGASRKHETDAAIEAGCDAVLNKPVSPRDLLTVVDGLLAASRQERIREVAEIQRKESLGLIRASFPDLKALWELGPEATDREIRQLMQGTQVTVCSFCQRARFPDDWRPLPEDTQHFFQSWTTLSHAICPECLEREYPDVG